MQTVPPMASHRKMACEEAEALAVNVFSYLASDEEHLARFLSLTGLEPGTLRTAAQSPGFFPAVLDHVAGYEPLLIETAKALHVKPERIMEARWTLSPSEFE
jgi:hypothetical protein